MKRNSKATALVLILMALSFIVFSMLASLHTHKCIDDACSICQLVDNVRRILGTCAVLSFVFAYVDATRFVNKAIGVHKERSLSLVSEGVKITS